MESSGRCLLLLVLAMSAFVAVTASERFKVGGHRGWREPDHSSTDLYEIWASKFDFSIGDSLYFEYKNDSVLIVDKWGYYHCNTTGPIASFFDGKTVISLDRPGLYFFISGVPEHCLHGQRLSIEIKASTPILPPQSPAVPITPSPPPSAGTPAPAPAVSATPTPAPQPSAAAGTLSISIFMGGIVAVSTLISAATCIGV